MKTFSKVLSMVLVVVMCFGLFATSAYASFSLDDNSTGGTFSLGGSFDDSASFGGYDSGDNDAGFSLGGSAGSFDLNDSTAPSFDLGTSSGSFNLDTPSDSNEPNILDPLKGEDDSTFSLDGPVAKDVYDPTTMTSFTADKTSIDVTDTDANCTVRITANGGGNLDTDTFDGYFYSTSGDASSRTTLKPGTDYTFENGDTLVLLGSFMKKLSLGQYYFFGNRTGKLPIELAIIVVAGPTVTDYGTFTAKPNPFTKYEHDKLRITADDTTKNFSQFTDYAIVAKGSTSGNWLTDYSVKDSDNKLVIESTDLLGLNPGQYEIYGRTSYGANVKLCTVTIKNGTGGSGQNPKTGEDWILSPDYGSVSWNSGDDYLWFWSDLMAQRQYYNRHTIVLKYGIGADSVPTRQVDVNQYWDLKDGAFCLGTNFLNSLSSGVYTLQVIDIKTWECTNTVNFRIGSKLRAIDTDKHVIGSIKNLRFICDDPIQAVYVGGIPLTYGEDYALSNNNRTVTLSFEFLNKRSAGYDYNIKVLTIYGDYPNTTFHILSSAQGSASPRTGDESNLGLWAAFLLLSGTAIVVLVPKLRKHGM